MKKLTLVLTLALVFLLLLTSCGKDKEPASETGTATAPASESAQSETSTGFSLSISEEYAMNMLKEYLPADTPYTITSLDFTAPNITNVSGQLNLRALAEQYKILSFVAVFLPTSIDFTSSCSYVYATGEGFTVTPIGLSVEGFDVPTEVLPESLYNYYASFLNDYINSLPFAITSVTMDDNGINIAG